MKTHLFPRFTRSLGSRMGVYSAITILVAIGCVGAVMAQTDFSIPPIQGSSIDTSTWINQQIQNGQTTIGSGTNSSSIQSSSSISLNSGTCTSGCSSSICQGTTDTASQSDSCVTVPCNPFAELMGKWIVVHLEGNLPVAGMLYRECSGFLILKTETQTLTVSIQKILVIESN